MRLFSWVVGIWLLGILLFGLRTWQAGLREYHLAQEYAAAAQNLESGLFLALGILSSESASWIDQARQECVLQAGRHARRALEWNPYCRPARRLIWEMAQWPNLPAWLRLGLYRDLRSVTLAARHVGQPYRSELSELNRQIGNIAGGFDDLENVPKPASVTGICMSLAFLSWIGVTLRMIWSGFSREGDVCKRPLVVWGYCSLGLLTVWLILLSRLSGQSP